MNIIGIIIAKYGENVNDARDLITTYRYVDIPPLLCYI
jgi:hypothetical protein